MQGKWVKWALVATGLATTSCAGFVGAGAAAAMITAGYVGFTCYDRVSVTVTDRLTGRQLCDAKVSFFQGKSETVATSCYQAALTAGKYRMHVERPGLESFDQRIVVSSKRGECGQTVQTMYVALDRVEKAPAGRAAPSEVVLPPVNGTVVTAPSAAAPTGSVTAPPAAPSEGVTAPPVATPPAAAPSGSVTAPPAAAPPAGTAFPETPAGAR